MEAVIQELTRNRVREAVATLTKAFIGDPIFNHYFPDRGNRAKVFTAFFNDVIHANLRFGHVYCALADGQMIGAAVWNPPGATTPTLRDRIRSTLTKRHVERISRSAGTNLFAGFAELERLHPQRPHWHLMFIGVDKQTRTKRVGSRLMEPLLSLADQRGELCYLETPFPETHDFYHRLGFEITKTCRPFPGAPSIWIMSREPRSR